MFVALIKKNSEVPSCSRIADNFNITLKQQIPAKKPGHMQKMYKKLSSFTSSRAPNDSFLFYQERTLPIMALGSIK